jgi:hypothetical protein
MLMLLSELKILPQMRPTTITRGKRWIAIPFWKILLLPPASIPCVLKPQTLDLCHLIFTITPIIVGWIQGNPIHHYMPSMLIMVIFIVCQIGIAPHFPCSVGLPLLLAEPMF